MLLRHLTKIYTEKTPYYITMSNKYNITCFNDDLKSLAGKQITISKEKYYPVFEDANVMYICVESF